MDNDACKSNKIRFKDIRREGRKSLEGKWNMVVLSTIIYGFLVGIIQTSRYSLLIDKLSYGKYDVVPSGADIPLIIFVAIVPPLTFGLYSLFLKLVRGEESNVEELFSWFRRIGKTICFMLLVVIKIFLWSLLFVIPGIIAAYRYSMAHYILIDNPDMPSLEAIAASTEMMKGYKWKLFLLQLSFIGWFLLCILSLGIGFIWLKPYMMASISVFYCRLKDN